MMRLRRSVLFTPATAIDRYQKALAEGRADTVVADLEDAVPPEHKDAARRAVAQALRDVQDVRSERAVRINSYPGPWAEADLEAVLPSAPELIVVPKAEDPAAVAELGRRVAPDGPGLLLILETARGVLRALELAEASPQVVALAFGAEDLAADAGLRRTPGNAEVAYARSHVALAAAAAGVQAIDMVTVALRDLERTADEAREARGLGYTGKMCLHPMQVVAVHEALRPSAEEEAWARRLVEAADAAGAGEGGVVVVEGRMVDVPLLQQARRVLEEAQAPP